MRTITSEFSQNTDGEKFRTGGKTLRPDITTKYNFRVHNRKSVSSTQILIYAQCEFHYRRYLIVSESPVRIFEIQIIKILVLLYCTRTIQSVYSSNSTAVLTSATREQSKIHITI